jgi:hypothetical protein
VANKVVKFHRLPSSPNRRGFLFPCGKEKENPAANVASRLSKREFSGMLISYMRVTVTHEQPG